MHGRDLRSIRGDLQGSELSDRGSAAMWPDRGPPSTCGPNTFGCLRVQAVHHRKIFEVMT